MHTYKKKGGVGKMGEVFKLKEIYKKIYIYIVTSNICHVIFFLNCWICPSFLEEGNQSKPSLI